MSPFTAKFSRWFHIVRPKTLTAAIVPFMAASALVHSEGGEVHGMLLLWALMSAICIQIGTNLINDAADHDKGADTAERLGPLRAVQQQLATSRQLYKAGIAAFALGFIFGIPLIAHSGWGVAIILLLSIASGYAYTAGALPLAYIGLGDVFVFVFFGLVATIAGYWIQMGRVDAASILLGTQIGLLCTAMIAINNLRDIAGDAKVGKKTLAVRFGETFSRLEISALVFLPYMLGFIWLSWEHTYAALLPWIAFPFAQILFKKVWTTHPSRAYNQFLGLAALLHLSFGVLLTIGLFLK